MVQLLKSEVDGLLKGRQARNQAIGPFPKIDLQYFDVAYPTFDLVDCKTGASPLVNAHRVPRGQVSGMRNRRIRGTGTLIRKK